MAKQVITLLTDDLDGGEADRTVEFGLDGVNYTIDLSEKNAGKLRKALDPFLNAATRVGRTTVGLGLPLQHLLGDFHVPSLQGLLPRHTNAGQVRKHQGVCRIL